MILGADFEDLSQENSNEDSENNENDGLRLWRQIGFLPRQILTSGKEKTIAGDEEQHHLQYSGEQVVQSLDGLEPNQGYVLVFLKALTRGKKDANPEV